jgi:hypothetical protein
MKGLAVSRKVNYASFVKINTPTPVGGRDFSKAVYRHVMSITVPPRLNKFLDNGLIWIIIRFTVTALVCALVADVSHATP